MEERREEKQKTQAHIGGKKNWNWGEWEEREMKEASLYLPGPAVGNSIHSVDHATQAGLDGRSATPKGCTSETESSHSSATLSENVWFTTHSLIPSLSHTLSQNTHTNTQKHAHEFAHTHRAITASNERRCQHNGEHVDFVELRCGGL